MVGVHPAGFPRLRPQQALAQESPDSVPPSVCTSLSSACSEGSAELAGGRGQGPGARQAGAQLGLSLTLGLDPLVLELWFPSCEDGLVCRLGGSGVAASGTPFAEIQ